MGAQSLTPSTARQQYLKELRATCSDELTYHKKKADRSVTPTKRDLTTYTVSSEKRNVRQRSSDV